MQPKENFTRKFMNDLRNGRLTTTFALLAALTVGILAGSALTGHVSASSGQRVDSSDARPLSIPNPVTLSNGFSAIVKQVGPAVVNINTESLPKPRKSGKNSGRNRVMPQQPNGDDDGSGGGDDDQSNPFQDFFNRFGGGGQMPDPGPQRALGSGFIVDPRGYIITNNHVVDKADKIMVKLSSDPDSDPGRPATVIGTDPDTDIAVIKIDSKTPLPTVKLGNSDGAQVGDWVLAIGTPFGQRNTVSAGIISAKGREIDEGPGSNGFAKNQFQRFIQTDAAINPGNSGGPLVDMTGAVVGMNTAIFTQSAGSEGIGFAMPANTIIGVYNMLIGPEHKVTRGSIGITFQAQESSAVSRMYGFAAGGVLVSTVTPNGPAQKAGIQPGDAITTVDGQPVKDGDELVGIISAKAPGSTVKIGYIRNGKKESTTVGITDRSKLFVDAGPQGDDNSGPATSDSGQVKLGITVSDVSPNAATKLGIKGGVQVQAVRPGSFADEAGMVKGDVIVEINRHPVTDQGSFTGIVGSLKSGDDVVFVVRRAQAQGPTYLGGTLP